MSSMTMSSSRLFIIMFISALLVLFKRITLSASTLLSPSSGPLSPVGAPCTPPNTLPWLMTLLPPIPFHPPPSLAYSPSPFDAPPYTTIIDFAESTICVLIWSMAPFRDWCIGLRLTEENDWICGRYGSTKSLAVLRWGFSSGSFCWLVLRGKMASVEVMARCWEYWKSGGLFVSYWPSIICFCWSFFCFCSSSKR